MALALVMAPILTLVLTFGQILAQTVSESGSESDSESDSESGSGSGSDSGFARPAVLTLTLILTATFREIKGCSDEYTCISHAQLRYGRMIEGVTFHFL